MENLSLYQINEKFERLEQKLYNSTDKDTGEILDQEILQEFKAIKLTREEKFKSCIYIIHKTEDNVELAKKEIARLKDFIAKNEKVDEKVRNLIACNVEPGKKLDLGTVGIGWRKSTGLIIDNEEEELAKIEKEIKEFLQEKMDQDPKMAMQILGGDKAPYTKIKIEATFNKSAIKDDLKNGIEIQGCRLDERENMQIK